MKKEQYWKRLIQYTLKDCVTHIHIIMSVTCFGPFVSLSGFIYIYKLKLKIKLQYMDTIPYSQLHCVYYIRMPLCLVRYLHSSFFCSADLFYILVKPKIFIKPKLFLIYWGQLRTLI
jgi:hypothetical protein